MAAREIKTQLVLDGEKEYRAGLENAYKTVTQLGRELKLTAANFLDNADSMEAHTAKAEVLRKEIAAQKEMITSLAERVRYAEGAYDGNTEAQELYTQKIDKAMRALTRMEKELATTESAMAQMESATEQAAQELTQAESAVTDMGSASAKAAREVDTAKTSTKGMSETAAAAQKSVEKLSGGFTVLKGTLSNLVADALRKGANLLKEFTRDSITMASDLEEVDNVVSTAFAGSEESIRQFADAAATQFGLSSLAAQSYAGKLGAALNALGLAEHAAEMSTTLTGLSGDLASFWNITADESYAKIFAGVISGQTEGLKSIGIVMSDTNLQAFALKEGITKKTSAMTADEKAMLRYRFVLDATQQAQGDFAKTAGSYANQMRIASLQTSNAQAAIGDRLVPAVTRAIGKFNEWMQGDYGKQVIQKTADAAGDFAEGALTVLGNTLSWIIEHLDAIKTITAAMMSGMLMAKVTRFGMTMVNLVRTLAAASKATSVLNAAMAMNPALAVGLAVAVLTGGLIALISSYETLDTKLKNLKLNVPQASVDAVTAGINEGIAAADGTHAVAVTIQADTQGLKEQLASFLDGDSAGGSKLTGREFKAISKYVKETVQPDIDEAKRQMAAQKADFQKSLLAIVEENGQSVFSEARASELADGLSVKTQKLIDELTQYKNDYLALAKQIYKDGRTPTEAEIENLNTLLEKIGAVRIQLNEAQDSATQVLKARAERVQGGQGSEKDFGAAVGFVKQRYANEASDRHATNETLMAQLQTQIDTWKALLATGEMTAAETVKTEAMLSEAMGTLQTLFAADEQVDTQVFAEQQAQLQKLLDGMAKTEPEAMAALESYASLRDQYAQFIQSLYSAEGLDADEKAALLTPENLKTYLGLDMSQADIDAMFADPLNFDTQIDSYLLQIKASMEEKIGQAGALMDNPMLAYLQSMLDNGSLDNLDVTALDGSLETALKAMDLVARGAGVGADLVAGITGGIGESAGALTAGDLTSLRDAVLEQTRAVFDSHSPARVMHPVGEDITAGLTEGMTDDTALGSVTDAAEAIDAALRAALLLDLRGEGANAITTFASGMQSRQSTAVAVARDIAGGAAGALSLYSSFSQLGRSNMDGFIAGLRSRSQAVTTAITELMREAIQAARDTLGIKSPSRVFAQIGAYAAAGYGQGFSEQMAQVERMVQQRLHQSAKAAVIGLDEGRRETPGGTADGGIHITQHVYANETSYAGQQREAARQLRVIARRIRG